jgi:acetolactate synthase-1/2/3 large subunit
MTVSDYLTGFLIKKGTTDVFGMPGEIILDLLYSFDENKNNMAAHLCYHEQSAAFAASGYAQASGKLGVAYATKGPGFANLITGIADCYHNSIPVFFITAHAQKIPHGLRFDRTQELDTVRMASSITKYAERLENAQDVPSQLEYAYQKAMSGRPGPVLLDFAAALFKAELEDAAFDAAQKEADDFISSKIIVKAVALALQQAKRPVLLIGDGIHQSGTESLCKTLAENLKIPVVSSRFSQDVLADCPYYYGYIGSHGLRYSNFILSKCDLVVSIGNRLAYNPLSKSFAKFVQQAKVIRIDIDKNELERDLPGVISFHSGLSEIMPRLAETAWQINREEWISLCGELKETLCQYDASYPVSIISDLLRSAPGGLAITSDVGNNEMWLSRAYAFSRALNRVLYSNNFGSLGCSLPKAIGAYYATKKRVVCFTGDQGLQINLQELQFLASARLPITIVILNNRSSGMIRERQERFSHFMHATKSSGYSAPDFKAIADAFSIPYFLLKNNEEPLCFDVLFPSKGPVIGEVPIDETLGAQPKLPMGSPCQDLEPLLERALYARLDRLRHKGKIHRVFNIE